MVSFEVVNQVPKRYPGADEHGSPTQYVGIAVNDDGCAWHTRLFIDSNAPDLVADYATRSSESPVFGLAALITSSTFSAKMNSIS